MQGSWDSLFQEHVHYTESFFLPHFHTNEHPVYHISTPQGCTRYHQKSLTHGQPSTITKCSSILIKNSRSHMLGSTFIEPLGIECRQNNGILRGTKLRSKPYIRRKRSTLPARNSMVELAVEHVHDTTMHSLTSKFCSNPAAITSKKPNIITERQYMLQLPNQLASMTRTQQEAPRTRIKAIWNKKTIHEFVDTTNPQTRRNKETQKLRNCLVVVKPPSRSLNPLVEFYAAKKRTFTGSEPKRLKSEPGQLQKN